MQSSWHCPCARRVCLTGCVSADFDPRCALVTHLTALPGKCSSLTQSQDCASCLSAHSALAFPEQQGKQTQSDRAGPPMRLTREQIKSMNVASLAALASIYVARTSHLVEPARRCVLLQVCWCSALPCSRRKPAHACPSCAWQLQLCSSLSSKTCRVAADLPVSCRDPDGPEAAQLAVRHPCKPVIQSSACPATLQPAGCCVQHLQKGSLTTALSSDSGVHTCAEVCSGEGRPVRLCQHTPPARAARAAQGPRAPARSGPARHRGRDPVT